MKKVCNSFHTTEKSITTASPVKHETCDSYITQPESMLDFVICSKIDENAQIQNPLNRSSIHLLIRNLGHFPFIRL